MKSLVQQSWFELTHKTDLRKDPIISPIGDANSYQKIDKKLWILNNELSATFPKSIIEFRLTQKSRNSFQGYAPVFLTVYLKIKKSSGVLPGREDDSMLLHSEPYFLSQKDRFLGSAKYHEICLLNALDKFYSVFKKTLEWQKWDLHERLEKNLESKVSTKIKMKV